MTGCSLTHKITLIYHLALCSNAHIELAFFQASNLIVLYDLPQEMHCVLRNKGPGVIFIQSWVFQYWMYSLSLLCLKLLSKGSTVHVPTLSTVRRLADNDSQYSPARTLYYFMPDGRLFTLPYRLARVYLMYAAGSIRPWLNFAALFGQCLCVTKNRRIVTRRVFYLEFYKTTSNNTKVNFNDAFCNEK